MYVCMYVFYGRVCIYVCMNVCMNVFPFMTCIKRQTNIYGGTFPLLQIQQAIVRQDTHSYDDIEVEFDYAFSSPPMFLS